jgi:hypothetical protein
MTRNVGGIDKWLRIAAGIVVLALGIFGPIGWWGAIGLVPLLTGLVGICPLYRLVGVNTCPLEQRRA